MQRQPVTSLMPPDPGSLYHSHFRNSQLICKGLYHVESGPFPPQRSNTHQPFHHHVVELFSTRFSSSQTRMLAICQHIHKILRDTPQLWSFIDANWNPALVKEWLTRSATCSLTINLITQRSLHLLLSLGVLRRTTFVDMNV
jgi:hypothetical protein